MANLPRAAFHAEGFPARNLPRVLAYHKVTNFELGGTWVPARRFAHQMDALLEAGFRFIDEAAFLDALDGRRAGSNREILLTFDDGYRGLLEGAIPALEARKIPTLVFLVSAFVGKENTWDLRLPGRRFRHLGWDEVGDLARRGFSFGSHTCTHRDLTRLSLDDMRDELIRSKREIESRLDLQVRSLSYPFARITEVVRSEAARAGYRAAFTLSPRRDAVTTDRFELRREGVYVIDTVGTIKCKLGSGLAFRLEDGKGRMINAFARLTPLIKGCFSRTSTTSRRE
jgi:peptidoglycan/xylan/chitin deacetylase (PgdA/CDA1 family)